jgi:DNA-binding NarL/FixJ family response regulator
MTTHNMYNLMLGEDEDLERRAVQRLVELHLPCIKLVGTATTTSELLIWTHQKQAQLVLLDSHLPGMPLATTLNLLLGHYPQLKVVIMADFDEERLMESCLRFGAFAYLTRPVSPARIQQALAMAAHVLDTLA